jgi:ankyrin repeat protein
MHYQYQHRKILVCIGNRINKISTNSFLLALTIAADKGHHKFVELLLLYGATIDVRNKKGATPLWLACNGGHLEVVQLLLTRFANPDSSDSRKVSCLMAAFRKGHIKVVKYLVRQVRQFPSDTDCRRLINTITDKVKETLDISFRNYSLFFVTKGFIKEMSNLYGSNHIR